MINNQVQYQDLMRVFRLVKTYNKPNAHSLSSINYRAHRLNKCVDIEQRENMLNQFRQDMNQREINLLIATACYLDHP